MSRKHIRVMAFAITLVLTILCILPVYADDSQQMALIKPYPQEDGYYISVDDFIAIYGENAVIYINYTVNEMADSLGTVVQFTTPAGAMVDLYEKPDYEYTPTAFADFIQSYTGLNIKSAYFSVNIQFGYDEFELMYVQSNKAEAPLDIALSFLGDIPTAIKSFWSNAFTGDYRTTFITYTLFAVALSVFVVLFRQIYNVIRRRK